ncbi:MAG: ribonuclease III [Arenicella sp.]|jgi:ribonuclease-3|nr:ribonuclease III [Arenicella sp.]HAU68259.1 ribonuclease III [Gammaproteobacteria bacterium]
MNRFARLMKGLGHTFENPTLLELALTHRSKSAQNYERMEFLGDSILGFVIAEWLFNQFDELSEGKLSRMRSSLVRRETLALVARNLKIGDALLLGEGELKSGGFDRDSILADSVESIIGAIYLDAGFAATEKFIHTHFADLLSQTTELKSLKDPKSRLQELMQKMGYRLPSYVIVGTSGQHHDQLFTIECTLDELPYVARATAKSRRQAEQTAAKEILDTHFKT